MRIFKRRTTKNVGRQIGRDLQEIKRKEKVLRTLEKEEEIRKKKKEINEKLRKIRSERPSFLKSIGRGVKSVSTKIGENTQNVSMTQQSSTFRNKRKRPIKCIRTPIKIKRKKMGRNVSTYSKTPIWKSYA